MDSNSIREWRVWKILLIVHLIAYFGFFVNGLNRFYNGAWYETQNNFIILMIWTFILLVHVGLHQFQAGRGNINAVERQAYRDGFADAVRQLANRPDAVERLALIEDEAIYEDGEKRKRRM